MADPNALSDDAVREKMQDDLRAQAAKYDRLVRDMEALGNAPGHAAKACRETAHWLKIARPDFSLPTDPAQPEAT